jgi:hypothetical protein
MAALLSPAGHVFGNRLCLRTQARVSNRFSPPRPSVRMPRCGIFAWIFLRLHSVRVSLAAATGKGLKQNVKFRSLFALFTMLSLVL